jgi:hypothetical protein
VIVPAAVRKEEVCHSVFRRPGHTTLLACVSAAGDAMTPLLITSTPIRDSLWSRDLRQDKDFMIRRRSPIYADEELFFEYISNVFILYVDAVRGRPGLETEISILLMDSTLPHISTHIRQNLGQKDIVAITFPAHTTNRTQCGSMLMSKLISSLLRNSSSA